MVKNRCKSCGKKMFYKWEKATNGRKMTKQIDGVSYYLASCPECGIQWYVKRQEDNCRSDYHPAQVPSW